VRQNLTFGAWLRGRRAEKGQTQEEARAEVGVSRANWAQWETEARLPKKIRDLTRLSAWAENVTATQLFELVIADLDRQPGVGETPAAS